ncbi:MAG TPA: hypothetical protein VEB21_11980 [Terriglobales bacterium]|nr:hypothetical protein [Terriglobales bacterium]
MSSVRRLAVIAALPWECRPLLRRMSHVESGSHGGARLWRGRAGRSEVWLMQTGIGIDRAERATAWLLGQKDFAGCLSIGCAGALSPDLTSGALIAAESVVAAHGRISSDAALTAAVIAAGEKAGLHISSGAFLCSPTLLATATQKFGAHHRHGAVAVEMEGSGIAAAAARATVPFAAVRAVLDTAVTELPEPGAYLDPVSGAIRWRVLLGEVSQRPATVFHLARLGFAMRAAERSLSRFCAAFFA